MREVWRLNTWGRGLKVKAHDFDNDGICDLYFVVNRHVNNQRGYEVGIIQNGEVVSVQDPPSRGDYFKFLGTYDFDNDGYSDIIVQGMWTRVVEIFNGRNMEIIYRGTEEFGIDYLVDCKIGIDENGSTTPLFRQQLFLSRVEEQENGDANIFSYAFLSTIRRGTPFNDEYDSLTYVQLSGSFLLYDNGNTGSDYFAAGRTDKLWDYEGFGEIDSTYFELATSFNRSWDDPATTVLRREPMFDDNDQETATYFMVPHAGVVDYLDNDEILDWVIPYWDQAELDTYVVHVPIYNPDDFELQREYVERLEGLGDIPYNCRFCKGVKAVDINQDGTWELLLAIRGLPIRVLDPVDLSVIMVSNIPIPDAAERFYEVGYFQEDVDNLQLLVRSDRSIIAYNLPRHWTAPNSVMKSPRVNPVEYSLINTYPNPFNSSTNIYYWLPKKSNLEISIYDINGQAITRLVYQQMDSGYHRSIWNASKMPTGVYICRMTGDNYMKSTKLVLMK